MVLASLALCLLPCTASSQDLRASARFGRIAYEGAPAGGSASPSVVLGLGRSGVRDWLGISAAVPLGEEPFWAVVAGWKRMETRGPAGGLLDLTGHGFAQRHSVAGSPLPGGPVPPNPLDPPTVSETDLSGIGAGAELMAGAYATTGALRIEARAGGALQRSRLGDVLQERALASGDTRLAVLLAPFTIRAETRAWLDGNAAHAYGGGALELARGPLRLWGSAGRWYAGGVDRVSWAAGVSAAIGDAMELQAGGRGNAFDPLYVSSTETSFWTGISLRIGGGRAARAPVPAHYAGGRATIRIAASAAAGVPSIAGDFTGWKPVPMRRDGSRWTYEAALAPGVYHYAFVAEDGSWFVPKSVPGRQDDGMGGHVAVLVVAG
jgi:hypothetical protein